MAGRDHLYRLFGLKPSLPELLAELRFPLASELLGASVSSQKQIASLLAKLADDERDELFSRAELILDGGHRMEKEEIEEILKKHGILFSGRDSSFVLLHKLIAQVGLLRADKLVLETLEMTDVEPEGSFSHYDAPPISLPKLESMRFVRQLEAELQRLNSEGSTELRLVKVRPMRVKTRMYVTIFFQRPDVDGRDISQDKAKRKKVELATFRRGAGHTFAVITSFKGKSQVMFRNPEAKLTRHLKAALGSAAWHRPNAIADEPTRYDLDVFKDPQIELPVLAQYAARIEAVLVSSLEVRAATGTHLNVKAPGRRGDVLDHFRQISEGAPLLMQESRVHEAVLKFLRVDDERQLAAKVVLRPTKIHVNPEVLDIVNDHLRLWGILGG